MVMRYQARESFLIVQAGTEPFEGSINTRQQFTQDRTVFFIDNLSLNLDFMEKLIWVSDIRE